MLTFIALVAGLVVGTVYSDWIKATVSEIKSWVAAAKALIWG